MTDARIFDTGYRAYDGPRGGLGHAWWSVCRHAIERCLGIRRTLWQKILPAVVVVIAFLPAIVFIGIVALFSSADFEEPIRAEYVDYYGLITFAVVLFTAFVAPEVLCTDRRTGMLGLYLASPLDRVTYVLSKLAAVLILLSIVTVLPVLLLVIAYTIEGVGPDGVDGVVTTMLRAVLAGSVVGLFYASLSLFVASFTDRRAFASAAIVLVLIISPIVVGVLVEQADVNPHLYLLDVATVPFTAVVRIWGERGDDATDQISTAAVYGATIAWIAAFVSLTLARYRRIRVQR